MLSPTFKGIFSSPAKRKRGESMTPMKRVRAKLEEGCDFETDADRQLSCRALCDVVIAWSAAKTTEDKAKALAELEGLLDGEARKGVTYEASKDVGDDQRLSGTPLHLAAMLDCPDAAKVLIDKGEASIVARFEGITPIEAAIKHNSTKTLGVLLDRIAELEAAAPAAPPAPAPAARPPLARAWTHSDPAGLKEGRLHRREDNDEGGSRQEPKLKATRRGRA